MSRIFFAIVILPYTHCVWEKVAFLSFFLFFFFFVFLGLHSQLMDVPRLRVDLGRVPLALTPAHAMQDPSCVCGLHHGSWQRWILNPLSDARDQICILMDTSQIDFH